MSRILVTVSFVTDVEEAAHFQMLTAIDNAIRENIEGVIQRYGVAADELKDVLEYYGAHIHPRWDLADFIGRAT